MIGENYSTENPEQMIIIDQKYYDIEFNLIIDEDVHFNTSDELIIGFENIEMNLL